MNRFWKKGLAFLGLGLIASLATPAHGEDLKVYWKEGIRLDSANEAFKLKLGGRIMNDWSFASGDDEVKAIGALTDGTEFRRARLYLSGTVYDNVEFKAQYDFAGDPDFKDVYLGLKEVGNIGGIRVGHFNQPFGLEELTSSKYITFMERSLVSTFVPGRKTGFMWHNTFLEDDLSVAAGVFRNSGDRGESAEDGAYNIVARVTGLPVKFKEEKGFLHLGASIGLLKPAGDAVRYRARPEAHISPRLVDTGAIAADGVTQFAAEASMVYESFSVQGEFVQAMVDSLAGGDDPSFGAFYLYASYFLTGERRKYKGNNYSRTKPKSNFGSTTTNEDGSEKKGMGAFEVALRFSQINLDDGAVTGGEMSDVTLGLNWYLNPNVRTMLNFVYADLKDVGTANYLMLRFQIDF